MALVESDSVLKKIYYNYIQEPFLKIKERWLAYFARFAIDDEPSTFDVETQIQSDQALLPKKERKKSVAENQPQLKLGRIAFLSNALGTTFGLGHAWRFPSLAYKYGGGAFLIMYTAFILLFGYSLHFAEVAVGQYSSKGTLRVFERVPLMQGLGYSILFYGYVLSTYYSHAVTFGIYYFASSFEFILPWSYCPSVESYSNETMCFMVLNPEKPYDMELKCPSGVIVVDIKKLCRDPKYSAKMKEKCCPSDSKCKEFNKKSLCRRRQHPPAYYWTTNIIRHHPPEDAKRWVPDTADLKLILCTFAAWFLIYVLVSAGLKWTGIISMAIMPFMCIAFVLMLVVAVNIKGAMNGIARFFVPKLSHFTKKEIWYAALSHSIFSLGVAMGPGFTLGSLSKFRNPCHIDTFFVTLGGILTSILSGSVVYCMIGYMESYTAVEFESASTKGTGTAIIAYSDILSKFPVSWLSSSVFFFLFTCVVAISVSCVVISTSSSISEVFKVFHKDRYMINFLLVFSSFLLSIVMTLREGVIIFTSLDNFTMRLVLPLICIFEVVTLLMYGLNLACEDIAFMIGTYPSILYKVNWLVFPPVAIAAFVYRLWSPDLTFWFKWTNVGRLIVAGILVIPIFIFMFINLLKYAVSKTPKHMFRLPINSEPNSEELRALRMDFKR